MSKTTKKPKISLVVNNTKETKTKFPYEYVPLIFECVDENDKTLNEPAYVYYSTDREKETSSCCHTEISFWLGIDILREDVKETLQDY